MNREEYCRWDILSLDHLIQKHFGGNRSKFARTIGKSASHFQHLWSGDGQTWPLLAEITDFFNQPEYEDGKLEIGMLELSRRGPDMERLAQITKNIYENTTGKRFPPQVETCFQMAHRIYLSENADQWKELEEHSQLIARPTLRDLGEKE